jgi:hypothetical protein
MVINYDFESQLTAAGRAGEELKGLRTVKFEGRKILKTTAWLLLVTGGVIFLTRKRLSPEVRLLKRFKRIILQQYGIDIPASSGLHEALWAIDNPAVHGFVDLYSEVIYRDRVLTRDERNSLERLLTEIKRN